MLIRPRQNIGTLGTSCYHIRTMPRNQETKQHEHFMIKALELARLGGRRTLPNPCVGAVIVYGGEIIGSGYHRAYGEPHAEIEARNSITKPELLEHSTLYVTLEPCAHFGKTPPCTDAIIKAKIPKVVVGCRDPFEQVKGRGIEKLRASGVEVIEGYLTEECVELNKRFILAHRLRRPYITLKWAQTCDGFMAPKNRSRLQISSKDSQALVHRWRGEEMAIAVGSKTLIHDNPNLTIRNTRLYPPQELPAQNPIRVIIGDLTSLTHNARICNEEAPTVVFSSSNLKTPKGVTIIPIEREAPVIPSIMNYLYKQNILSVFVEGGPHTLGHLINENLWDEARICTAPHTLGSGIPAPRLSLTPYDSTPVGSDTFTHYHHPARHRRLGLTYK